MPNFWKKLKPPILALAPLAGITDSIFRRLCKKYGATVVYSEMASAAALNYNPAETLKLLKFNKSERPYVVQLFGSKPEHFAVAARLVTKKIKPDGIDINFGCPVKKIMSQGAGAALFKNLKLSRAVIQAVLANTDLPVSIKVRTQAGEVYLKDFLKNIADLDIKALMIHGRTLKQGFSGPLDFSAIKEAKKYFSGIILVNGGINNYADMERAFKKTGAHGVGIGRGALGRPWIFKELRQQKEIKLPKKQIFKIALEHAAAMQKLKGKSGILEMRKHLCWYVNGLPGASALREQLVKVNSLNDIKKILK